MTIMAPYTIAHLKLGLQLESTGYKFKKDKGLGVYLTNTLEETAHKSEEVSLKFLKDEASGAFKIKRTQPIMVVIGNPPYSVTSQNDGNWIRKLMRGFDTISKKNTHNYFECQGVPLAERNAKSLNDDYVKFMRFAQWRIEQTGHGVMAFITNNGYLDNPTFRGMRESLIEDFDEIYLLDLHGSSRKKETSPDGSKDENVFDIQTGVSICFLIRNENSNAKLKRNAKVFKFDLYGEQHKKFKWLEDNSFLKTKFKEIKIIGPHYSYLKQDNKVFREYEKGIQINTIFPLNSTGIETASDSLCIQFSSEIMWHKIKLFSLSKEYEIKEKFKLDDVADLKIQSAQKDILSNDLNKKNIRPVLYRPFDFRFTYFTNKSGGFLNRPRTNVMSHMLSITDNIALITSRNALKSFNHIFLSEILIDGHTTEGRGYLYPLYKKDGSQTTINLSEEIQQILTQTYKQPIESLARPFFNYIYAIFYAPSFRTRYAEFLKQDFPRVQITPDKKLFFQLAKLGQELIDLHLLKNEGLEEGKTQFKDEGLLKNAPRIVSKVTYDSKSQKVFINENHYFSHIDEETFQFQVGGYQVLQKWLKDRKGRELTSEDISHYLKVVESLKRTQKLMLKIDDVILKAGGWPLVREELKKAA